MNRNTGYKRKRAAPERVLLFLYNENHSLGEWFKRSL